VLARVQELRPIAEGLGLSMPQLALAWVLQNPNVAAAVVGASRPGQLEETVGEWDTEIPPDAMARIDGVLLDSVERGLPSDAERTPARPG
jgi:aryl-alcohol dehydrogenase-like predicted oxidoreductase